jgi:uncharacterized protein (DUF1015 family)
VADRLAKPIDVAWVSTGGTGARNYDEFASDDEIEAAIEARPASILTVEMPHCTPADRAAGRSFDDVLPDVPRRLRELKDGGRFARAEGVVLPYRTTSANAVTFGVWVMVDTAEISTSAAEPGRVLRNEEVFAGKVRERLALTRTLGHLASAVLLVNPDGGPRLVDALAAWCAERTPTATDTDEHGNLHEVWTMAPGADQERVLDLVDTGTLIVADGNHRSLAAQQAGLPAFLAVVTAPDALVIRPYHRLVRSLGMPVHDFVAKLQARGFAVQPLDRPVAVPSGGEIELYVDATGYRAGLPAADGALVDRLDHTVVERALLGDVLGLGPDDPAVGYVGGDHEPGWLAGEVDAGRAAAAILVAPVTTEQFVEVNRLRMTMPRKSTWFTPKARAGLVLAEL